MRHLPHCPNPVRSLRSAGLNLGRSILLSSCMALWVLSTADLALAGYTPPANASRPTAPPISLGTRGTCSSDATKSLKVLAPTPTSHAGQTISTHPTLAWFVPEAEPIETEIHLYHYLSQPPSPSSSSTSMPTQVQGQVGGLVKQVVLQSQPGLNHWTLPSSEPALTPGLYYWHVVLLCNPNHPSLSIVAGTFLEVVQRPGLEASLANADRLTRATRFEEAKLWYDALRETLTPDPDTQLQAFQNQLLATLSASE